MPRRLRINQKDLDAHGYTEGCQQCDYIIRHGVTTARSLKRRPELERWSAERLARVQATPWSLRAKPEAQVKFQEDAPAQGGPTTAAPPPPRRFRIKTSDLDESTFLVTARGSLEKTHGYFPDSSAASAA